MGLVLNDQPFDDDYSAEIIAKIRALSPDFDEYVVTQAYLLETTEDNVSPLWLRNRLICKLYETLADDCGLLMGADADDVADSVQLTGVMLRLAAKFMPDPLSEFLKARPEMAEFFREVSDEGDCIGEIIKYCHDMLPVDDGFEMLYNALEDKPGIVSSDGKFRSQVLDPIFAVIDAQGPADYLNGSNFEVVTAYLNFMGSRKQKIAKYAKSIYSSRVATEGIELTTADPMVNAVDAAMNNFEKELCRPAVLDSMVATENNTIKVGDYRSQFCTRWTHCLEYYCQREHLDRVPNALQMAIMIATMYVDGGETANTRVEIISKFEDVANILGDRYGQFRELLDNALANLVMVQEEIEVHNDNVN